MKVDPQQLSLSKKRKPRQASFFVRLYTEVILMAGVNLTAIKGVGRGAVVSVDISDVLKTLGKVAGQSEQAMKATIKDVKSRAPG